MIYSDGIHLASGVSIEDLHKYCASIGIKRCWFHFGSLYPHYDIPKRRRTTIFEDHPEIEKVSSRRLIVIFNDMGYGLRGKK